jgi:lysophospholipase L1-like esterase
MLKRKYAAVVLSCALFTLATWASTQETKSQNTARTPVPRDANWMKRHEGFVEIAKKGGVEVLFLGDSITDGWRGKEGAEVWKKHFEPLKAANFGIGGDRTQHVLWRITNGELEGIAPKVAVLMIGTNNCNGTDNTAAEIADGITAIVKTLREKQPQMKVLLLAVFPRADKRDAAADKVPAGGLRTKIDDVNKIIAKLDDGKMVHYLDIGAKFLDADGALSKDVMPDFLHLSQKGYEIWGDGITLKVKEMLGE